MNIAAQDYTRCLCSDFMGEQPSNFTAEDAISLWTDFVNKLAYLVGVGAVFRKGFSAGSRISFIGTASLERFLNGLGVSSSSSES